MPLDVAVDPNSDQFYMYGRRIVKSSPPFRNIKIIGKRGVGPEEYGTPYRIALQNNHLFYSDATNSLIKSIILDKNDQSRLYRIGAKNGGSKVIATSNYLATINMMPPHLSVFKLTDSYNTINSKNFGGKELKKEYIPLMQIMGGGITKDSKGNIYYCTVAPYQINILDINTFELKTINNENLIGVVPWDKKKYHNYEKADPRKKQKILRSFTRVVGMKTIMGKSSDLLLVHLEHPDKSQLYHLIKLDGTLIAAFKTKDWLIASKNEYIYFYKRSDINENKRASIIKYKIKI